MALMQALRRSEGDGGSPGHSALETGWASACRDERNVELCEYMIDITAALFNVSSKELRDNGRSSHANARVRQIAMYVAHVTLGLSMKDVGRGFGRDRTTVCYACHLIEDMREDEDFDAIIATIERVASAALRHRSGI